MKYGERASQLTTPRRASSFGKVCGTAVKQAKAVRVIRPEFPRSILWAYGNLDRQNGHGLAQSDKNHTNHKTVPEHVL
jgi:hypothetical protein